jgi:hypothetical protein
MRRLAAVWWMTPRKEPEVVATAQARMTIMTQRTQESGHCPVAAADVAA